MHQVNKLQTANEQQWRYGTRTSRNMPMPGSIQLRNHQKVSMGPTKEGRKVQASDLCSSHMQGVQICMQHRDVAPLHSAVACRLWAAMAQAGVDQGTQTQRQG